jgi:hypothetical protein
MSYILSVALFFLFIGTILKVIVLALGITEFTYTDLTVNVGNDIYVSVGWELGEEKSRGLSPTPPDSVSSTSTPTKCT